MLRAIVAAWVLAGVLAAQSIEGHIVNAATGADLPGATVIIRHVPRSAGGPYQTTTDAQGRFRMQLEPGTYAPFYKARGFWTDPAQQSYDSGPRFQVTASGPTRVEYKLQPLAKIAGRVLDPAGKPVANAHVWVLGDRIRCNGLPCYPVLKEAQTGEKGEYSIADLDEPMLTWLVSASAPAAFDPPKSTVDRPLGWAQTFYPDAREPELAAKVQAKPGTEQWNLDIRLAAAPVHRIRGRVLGTGGDLVGNLKVTLYNGLGPTMEKTSKSDGTFEFGPVADGEWRLWAKLEQGSTELWTAQTVQVRDRDSDNVELRLAAPFVVREKFVYDAPAGVAVPDDAPPLVVLVYNAGSFGQDKTTPGSLLSGPAENGTFQSHLYPGPYRLDVLESPAGPFYLDSVRLGNLDALATDAVPILSGAETITVTYKYGGGSVHGTIDNCGGATVALVPVDPMLRRPGLVRLAACVSNGQFDFTAVRPGEYYALLPSWMGTPDESTLARSSKITVRNNEHTTAEIRR